MNSITKGSLFILFGVLSLLWFGYEVFGFVSRRGVPTEENTVISLTLTALKLVMAASFFVAGLKAFRTKE